ncbi:hypothetical protein ACS5PN_10090 [Roseateles sp. NT4]|uniref:hypothetical protein n=1 Tax=Roseateles sp. NT4 TaxID=3453715 RepID=UPI003EEC4324
MDSFIPLLITVAALPLALGWMSAAAYVHLSPRKARHRPPLRSLILACLLGTAAATLWLDAPWRADHIPSPWWASGWFDFAEFARSLGLAGSAMALAYRLGLRNALGFFAIAAACAWPIGHIMANPVDYRFSPTEEDFDHGPYADRMFIYMALHGLSGLTFGALITRQRRRDAGEPS